MLSFTACDGASVASSREDRIAASGAASAICRWIHFIATWHKSGAVLHGGRFAAGDACAKNSSSDACRCTDAKLVKKKEKVKYLYLIPSAVVSRWMNVAHMQILYCSLWDP